MADCIKTWIDNHWENGGEEKKKELWDYIDKLIGDHDYDLDQILDFLNEDCGLGDSAPS